MTKRLMMLAAVAAAAFDACSETETVGGYEWTYRVNGDTAEIYKGTLSPAISPSPTGAVTIPSMLGGRPVTSIGEWAFYECSGLTSVTIPDSVMSVGDAAFSRCSGLASVTIPYSVTSISSSSFATCGKLWATWFRMLVNGSAAGGWPSGGGAPPAVTTIVQQVESPYALTDYAADRAIASVTVDGDCEIDEFVLKNGKVYDCVLYISNTANRAVTLTLPTGNVYKSFKGAKPLTIPAKSQHILTITRVADKTFLVSREELEDVQ